LLETGALGRLLKACQRVRVGLPGCPRSKALLFH